MPSKGRSEEQVVYALRQIEGGKKVSEVCREMGVSPQPVYRWKRRYGGLGLNEVRELRQLREENRQQSRQHKQRTWRKRVGVEPKLPTSNPRRFKMLLLPPSSNWTQLDPENQNSVFA